MGIRNYPTDDTLMFIVRCIYTVPVVFGVPINLSPAAASLQSLARRTVTHRAVPQQWRQFVLGCSDFALHSIIVTTVLTLCTVVAICSEAVADVIGLLGSVF